MDFSGGFREYREQSGEILTCYLFDPFHHRRPVVPDLQNGSFLPVFAHTIPAATPHVIRLHKYSGT